MKTSAALTHSAGAKAPETRTPAPSAAQGALKNVLGAAGNQLIQRLFADGSIRGNLRVGGATDPEEREADQIAKQVVDGGSCPCGGRGGATCDCGGDGQPGIRRKVKNGQHAPRTSLRGDLGLSGGRPLHDRERNFFEPRFGADLSKVRVHSDSRAEGAADAIAARAFTARTDVVFGRGELNFDSADGRLLIAHELAHVIQDQRGSSPLIRRQPRPEVPTSSGTDVATALNVTAQDWIQAHGGRVGRELVTQLTNTPFTLPVMEMRWRGGQAEFARILLAPVTAADGFLVWQQLPAYVRPDSLADAINIGRDCYPSLYGSGLWKQGVVTEIARRVSLRVVESLDRVAAPAARHRARAWNPIERPRPDVLLSQWSPVTTRSAVQPPPLIFLTPTGPETLPRGLAFSHPIDPWVYNALRESTDVDVAAYRARHPEEFTEAAVAAEEQPLRLVQFRFLASEGLPTWIRVSTPLDATPEEVANTLYGDPTAASRLTAAPPMFGIPTSDVPVDLFRSDAATMLSRDEHGRPARTGPEPSFLLLSVQLNLLNALRDAGLTPERIARGSGPELEILSSPMGDEAALRAASRIMPTPGANKALIQERIALIFNALVEMEAPAAQLARPPDAPEITIIIETGASSRSEPFVASESREIRARVTIARERVAQRQERLAAATEAAAIAWDAQTRGQLEIVTTALNGLRVASALAAGYRDWPNIYSLIHSIADAYVAAAEISDLYPSARARLDEAERRSVLFPATAIELWLAQIRAALDEARTSERTTVPRDPGTEHGVNELDRLEQELRDRLAQVRAQLIQDPEGAKETLHAILQEVRTLQTGTTLALNLDTVDRVWQALYNSLSVMGEIRAFITGGGNEDLSKGMSAALRLHSEWSAIMDLWRIGERQAAQEQLQIKAKSPEWRTWVDDMRTLIEDQQTYDRWMTFAAMVGIAVLSGGIGAYVEAAVGTAWGVGVGASAWARLGVAGVGILTEATTFTALSYPLTTRDPSVGDFASQFGQNVLFFAGGRALARGFEGLLGEARAATLPGRLATTAVVGAGFTGASLLMADAQSRRERGRSLTGQEAADITMENVAFIGATTVATALLRRPLASLRLEGELSGLNLRHRSALRMLDVTMREVQVTPEPAPALRERLIADTRRALEAEQALTDRMRVVVERADALVDETRPETTRARDRELARYGITDEMAGQLRSGAMRSQVLGSLRAMQGVRIAQALEPVGGDFAISNHLYEEALAYFRSLPDTVVVESGANAPVIDFTAVGTPRMEPGGQSFAVIPSGEESFRIYRRAPGAVGDIAGRVELAPSPEAAAAARDPMARPAQPGGGRAGASEIDWGLPQEAIEGVRQALLPRSDVGRVAASMRDAGIPATREQIDAVKRYLFDSRGISFDRANYEAWQRLANGRAQSRDIAFLTHELAEIRALEEIRRKTGFDYRGLDFDRMSATQRQQWQADFNRYYLEAHSRALEAEYAYVAEAVARATNGRVRIGRNIAASVDPTRGEARSNMLVDGSPLGRHRDFPTWQARASEVVDIGTAAQDRLRLPTRTPTLSDLIAALKRAPAGPEAAAAMRGGVALLPPPGGPRGWRGRTGAEAADPRVDPFLDSLHPDMARRFRDSGHAEALRQASAVVDYLTRPGERNVRSFESFIVQSTLSPAEAIPLLNDLLTTHPTMTSTQVMAWARAIGARWDVPRSDTSPHAARIRAAIGISRQARYAAAPEQAIADLRGLLADNVELPVAFAELTRPTPYGEATSAEIAGPSALGPDVRFTFGGHAETVGREMYATDLPSPGAADDPAVILEDALMRRIREKAIDYTRAGVPLFTRRELAVQVRLGRGAGYPYDALVTPELADRVMERVRGSTDTTSHGAENILDTVIFYNSLGQPIHTWSRP
jgi:hypothetical protein